MFLHKKQILPIIFHFSFRALSYGMKENKPDFHAWSETKAKTYGRLNKIVFRWVSRNQFIKPELADNKARQFLLDVLHEIVWDHYKNRLSLYKFCTKYNAFDKKFFVFASMLIAYKGIFKQFIYAALKNLKVRTFAPSPDATNLVFTIGFPEHSFSVSDAQKIDRNGQTEYPSSFGEFFLNKYAGKTQNTEIVSIDEYVRTSKSGSSEQDRDKGAQLAVISLTRHKTQHRWGGATLLPRMYIFIFGMVTLAGSLFKRNSDCMFEIMYFIYWARSLDYLRIINTAGKQVDAVFALPFSAPLGLIPYLKSTSEKLVYYSYSQNLCEPPTIFINRGRDYDPEWDHRIALSDMSPDAWSITGKAEGFNDIFEYINSFRRFLNARYSYKLPVADFSQSVQIPALLGYEIISEHIEALEGRYIVVFDVPPQERKIQFSGNFCGSPMYEHSVTVEYLHELTQACVKHGLKLFLKPKYSLHNYSTQYNHFLHSLGKRYGSSFRLLDPYGSTRHVLRSASGCVSMPFTSMKWVCDYINIPSIYYMPESFRSAFTKGGASANVHFGEDELANFLKTLMS